MTALICRHPPRQRRRGARPIRTGLVAGLLALSALPLGAQQRDPWSLAPEPRQAPWSATDDWSAIPGWGASERPRGSPQARLPYGEGIPRVGGFDLGVEQPDLTGTWRGSGGELVKIRGNYARIWGGPYRSCGCYFFVVADRLIAYSPATDVVRKFRFRGERDSFTLVNDEGHVMRFRRAP